MIKRYFAQKLSLWLNQRIPAQPSISLHSGNIFVFPNRIGWMFLGLTSIIYIIGTNYQNNLILLVAYGLAGLGLVSVFHGFFQLYNITLKQFGCEMCAVKDQTYARIKITANKPIHGLQCYFNTKEKQLASLTNAEKFEQKAEQYIYYLQVPFTPITRGVTTLPRLTVQTQYPLGIIRCWSKIDLAIEHIAYPQPITCELKTQSQIGNDTDGKAKSMRMKEATTEEFDGITPHKEGEPMNRIAWKQSARTDTLLNKQFKDPQGTTELSFRQFADNDKEQALSKLCFLVQQLSSSKQTFSLSLPSQRVAANSSESHRQQCLTALAKEPK